MIIIPAIDLLGGKCVRLYKGEYSTAHQVADDPAETAKRFIDEGAKRIHIVDLDGAKTGEGINFAVIEKLSKFPIEIQTGGGVRSISRIKTLFDAGVSRVVIGSAAVSNKDFLLEALGLFGEKIIVGADAKDGEIKTEGWTKGSGKNYIDFCKELESIGVKTIIFTDISKDGTLSGVNLKQLTALKEAVACDIIASGGVGNIGDIEALLKLGVYGAICGKSIYGGTLSLKEAIERSKCWQKG